MGLLGFIGEMGERKKAKQKTEMEFDKWFVETRLKHDKFDFAQFQERAQELDRQHGRDLAEIKNLESVMADPNKRHLMTPTRETHYKKLKSRIQYDESRLDQADGMLRKVRDQARVEWDDIKARAPVYSTAKQPSPGAIPVKSFKDVPALERLPRKTVTPRTETPTQTYTDVIPQDETDIAIKNLRTRQQYDAGVSRTGKEADVTKKALELEGRTDADILRYLNLLKEEKGLQEKISSYSGKQPRYINPRYRVKQPQTGRVLPWHAGYWLESKTKAGREKKLGQVEQDIQLLAPSIPTPENYLSRRKGLKLSPSEAALELFRFEHEPGIRKREQTLGQKFMGLLQWD